MKKTPSLAAVLALVVLICNGIQAEDKPAGTSTKPPRNLHKVGEHWTPWTPPDPKPDDYIIQKGDTLWGLGQQWLGNPFLWPQIWDQNRYVQDSHWIYPGDPIVRPGKPNVVPAAGPPPSEAGNEERSDTTPAPLTRPTPPRAAPEALKPLFPLAWEHDVACSGYIDPDHSYSSLWIAGRELERAGMGTGDVVFLSQGRAEGVQAGMDYSVRRASGRVLHPVTGAELGDMVLRLGKVRVLCAEDHTAVGVILDSCDPILESDELVPWSDIPVPNVMSMPPFDRYCTAPSGGPVGYIVAVKDKLDSVGTGNIIHADLGVESGVRPGDFLSLYREPEPDLPRVTIGQAIVLTVEPGTCTAKITRSVRELVTGDRAELSRAVSARASR